MFRTNWPPHRERGGDGWEGEPVEVDPRRFRVRVLDGAVVRRVWEVEGLAAVYGGAEAGVDFPDGVGAGVRIAVAQWGEGYGWGAETNVGLL